MEQDRRRRCAGGGSGRRPARDRSRKYSRRSLRCSMRDDVRQRREHVSKTGRRILGGRHDLDVADHVLAAAQRSDRARPTPRRALRAQADDQVRRRRRARPSGIRGMGARSAGSAAAIALRSPRRSRGRARFRSRDARPRSAADVRQACVQRRQLLDRDRARLEQPAQVGRQIGDRRLDQHPAARLVHLPQLLRTSGSRPGAGIRRGAGVGVGFDCGAGNEWRRGCTADGRGASPRFAARAASVRSSVDRSASLSVPRFGRRLLRRLLRFGRRLAASQSAMPPLRRAL